MVMMMMMCTRSNADKYDIEELYEFADHTGILERHRQLLAKPFHENQVYINDHDFGAIVREDFRHRQVDHEDDVVLHFLRSG